MSLINDITNVVTRPLAERQQTTLGSNPTPNGRSAADGVRSTFNTVFRTEFSGTLASVYQRGAAGEFDDRALALQEQAALQRLQVAQQAAGIRPTGGSNAAPDPQVVTGGGASAAPDMAHVAIAEQRELYSVRVRQSEARLTKISASLKEDFPLASQLVSASTGTWDPETFIPRTRDEAAAFAQRLVIDVAEAAARLEIVKTQLDAAKFELSQRSDPKLQALVGNLEAAYERQKAYVDKLARVADRHSSGQMTAAGQDARAGNTLRGSGDLPVDEIVAALRAEGATEEEITRAVGALEVTVEQERMPEGSTRLKAMASEMTKTLIADFNRRVNEMRDERERRDAARQEEQRLEDKRADRKRSEKAMADQRAAQRQAQRDADWQQWIAKLAAESANRRRQAG